LTLEERILAMRHLNSMNLGLKNFLERLFYTRGKLVNTIRRLLLLKPSLISKTQLMLNFKILLRKSFVRIILTLALPKPEAGWSWANITKEMKDQIVY
jgi:hypothetical protein